MATLTTGSLFDDGLDTEVSLVAVLAQSKPLTKAQQSFQRLVAKIELKRDQLKHWQAYGLRYNQRLAGEMEPLRAQLRVGQRQMAVLIDELLTAPPADRSLGRVQRAKLKQLLLDILADLLEDGDDAALEALHDKHSNVSRQEVRLTELELTQALLQDVLGLEIDDDHGAATAEELFDHAQRKMHERAERQAHRAAGAHGERGERGERGAKRSRASMAKAKADLARREQAAKEVGQSLRDVFRKLVSTLHPDREPDAEVRQRKTLLMQRVNLAYEANDLLTLLGLQLEIEQIDATHLSTVPPQRLAHYIQILREQLAGLESELERCVQPFRDTMGLEWRGSLTPIVIRSTPLSFTRWGTSV